MSINDAISRQKIADATAMISETLDRVKRTETRLTTFMIAHGMTPPTQKPTVDGMAITIPSMDCSLRDIILAAKFHGRHQIVHAGHILGHLDIWEEGWKQATTMPSRKGAATEEQARRGLNDVWPGDKVASDPD